MSVIEKRIELAGSKGRREVTALFDSGASYSCIAPALADTLEVATALPSPMSFGTAEGGRSLQASRRVTLDIHIGGLRLSDELMVIEGLSEDVIIGAKTLQAWRIKLDFEHDEVIVDPRVTKLRLG